MWSRLDKLVTAILVLNCASFMSMIDATQEVKKEDATG